MSRSGNRAEGRAKRDEVGDQAGEGTERKMRTEAKTVNLRVPELSECEERIGVPAERWVARCYEIASRIVEAGLVEGRVVYGHWLGPIDPKSVFGSKRAAGFCQHGWVILSDGRIFDPTRWVFEGKAPYLYAGPNDHYDEGGNQLREKFRGPPPVFDPDERQVVFTPTDLSAPVWAFVEDLLGLLRQFRGPEPPEPGAVTFRQLHWLATCPPNRLGVHARPVFEAIARKGCRAFIPIDNRLAVLGPNDEPNKKEPTKTME